MKTRRIKAQNIRYDGAGARDGQLYRFLIDSLTEYAVFAISPAGTVISWNSGAQKTFGYQAAEIIGRSFEIIFTRDDVAAGVPGSELARASAAGLTHHDRWHVRKDGTRFWGTNTVQPLVGAAGTLLGFTKLVRDITESYLAGQRLSDSEQQLRLLVESVRDYAIFCFTLDGTIRSWSPGAQAMFGYAAAEIEGSNVVRLLSRAGAAVDIPFTGPNLAAIAESTAVAHWLERKDGTSFLASGTLSRLTPDADGAPRGFVAIVHDTTERAAAEEDMRRRAQHDELTGLPNRRTFYDHVERAISFMRRRATNRFAVLFIDVDGFKDVNDRYGHIVADALLGLIARRLERTLRSEDIVARVGGDEFAILLNGVDGVADAQDAAQRILAQMRKPARLDAGDIFVSLSIGIAVGTPAYDRPEEILRDADAAMYAAKSAGRARAAVFDPTIAGAARGGGERTSGLRQAIERGELCAVYQPIIRLADGIVGGFEALVRWQHPQRGLLQPADFIPQAEASNAIIAIDRWMLLEACTQLAHWRSDGTAGAALQMSVNVSSKNFARDEFAVEVRKTLDASGLPAANLRLEMTESTAMERSPQAAFSLAAIRAFGVSIDVDDFGMGYASLDMLNHVFVDGLKIDSGFVASMNEHTGSEIVASVIALAHKLGVAAIAEGVESPEQLQRLIELGCDFGQGTAFAAPFTADAAATFLLEPNKRKRIVPKQGSYKSRRR